MIHQNKLAFCLGLFVALCLGSLASASAGSVTISASNSGWFAANGFHNAANKNYIAGDFDTYHNFFTFDLSGINGAITGATLRLFNPAGGFDGDPGTYTLYDVFTSAAVLNTSHSGASPEDVAIYNDLGSGTVYGTVTVSALDNGTLISINLNAAAIAALNSANNGLFSIGGALRGSEARIFANSDGLGLTKELVVQTNDSGPIPEPMTLVLFGTGLAACAAKLRRRKQT
jgi:hypothetical protein